MKRLTILLTLGLFILVVFSSTISANQKSEGKPSKAETKQKVFLTDEMAEILNHYFAIRDLLAHDKTDGVATQAEKMSRRLQELIDALQAIRIASDTLKTADLKQARESFGPLSEAVLNYIKRFGFSGRAFSFFCPMVKQSWLQENDQIGNPYYGSKMYKCGKLTGTIENGRYVEK